MGDSYGSGEGHPAVVKSKPTNYEDFTSLSWSNTSDFYTPAPNPGFTREQDTFTCHRSSEAPVAQVNRRIASLYGIQAILGHVACSGADIGDVLFAGYAGPGVTTASMRGYTKAPQPAQLDRLKTMSTNYGGLDAVYMSIGGNDSGFGEFLNLCLNPFDAWGCQDKEDELAANLARLPSSYTMLNDYMDYKLGATTPVFISLYPNPLQSDETNQSPPLCSGSDYDAVGKTGWGEPDEGLRNTIVFDEARWAYDVSSRINAEITSAASNAGWTVVPVPFHNAGMCTVNRGFNLNSDALAKQGRDIADTAYFVYSAGFVHPNGRGYGWYADTIFSTMRARIDTKVRNGLVTPTSLRTAAATATSLTIRWQDRSVSDNMTRIEVVPARSVDVGSLTMPAGSVGLTGGGYRLDISGSGVQQHLISTTRTGQYNVKVASCNSGLNLVLPCSSFTSTILSTNIKPSGPTGLTYTTVAPYTLRWTADPLALDYVIRETNRSTGATVVKRVTTLTTTSAGSPSTTYYDIAACNRAGCSGWFRFNP